jgi:hypothetical protein
MKRAAVVLPGLVIVGATIWGLVTYGPYLRWFGRVRWRAIAASRREPAAVEAWQKEFGDPAATLAAIPLHGDNATAASLRALGPGAGVNFTGSVGDAPPARAIGAYVSAEEIKTGGPVGPPPDAVRSYLETHQPGVDAIVDLLTHGERPAWKNMDWWYKPPDIPLVAIKQLNGILAARALADSSRGRAADAERALLASWQLSGSTRESPELVGQLFAEDITTVPAILARRLTVDNGSWLVRLGEADDPGRMLIRAMVVHGSLMFSKDNSQMGRAARADYLDLEGAELVRLRDLPVTAPQLPAFSKADAMRDGWSAGAIIAVMAQAGDQRMWLGASIAMLQIELTDRVLHARQLRVQLGRWPAATPDIEASRLGGVHWVYRVGQDGRMSISISQPLESTGPPLRFESRQ